MNSKVNLADNLLLVGVIAVIGLVAFWFVSAIIGTILFAFKVFIVVIAIGLGWRVVSALTHKRERQ